MLKYFTLLLLNIICLTEIVQAQRVRYRDVVIAVEAMSDEEALARLKEYLLSDLDNPNANLRIALIHQRAYRNSDPLTAYESTMAHAEVARLRFTKVSSLINESEIKRNEELYINLAPIIDGRGRRVADAPIIVQMVRNGYDSANQLMQQLPSIYKNFTKSVDNYNQAIKLFSDICGRYSSLSELYLLYDDELRSTLSNLKQKYDSSIFYFNQYQQLIKAYPLKKYNQQYLVKPINTYRLEGLITQMNFLENNLVFWDYGKWVDDVNKVMATEIAKLRLDLEANEKKINKALTDAANKEMAGFEPVRLDKQTMFNLKKHDYQSLVAALLEYKEFKQNLVNKLQAENYFSKDQTMERTRIYTFYSDIINNTRYVDSLLQIISERNVEQKFAKHKQYLENYYAGKSGLENFLQREAAHSKNNFTLYVGRLREELISLHTEQYNNIAKLKHRNIEIPLSAMQLDPDSLLAPAVLTMHRQDNADGSFYLSGTHRPDKKNNNLVAFVARITSDGKMGWFKEFNFSDQQNIADNLPAAMVSTREGCAIVMHVLNKNSQQRQNKLIYLHENGDEKFSNELDITDYPRKINYREDNSSFVLLLKGASRVEDIAVNQTLHLMGYNTLGDLLWKRNYEMAGNINDLINLQQGYLLVINYTIFKEADGRTYRTRISEGQTNVVLLRLSERGDQRNLRPINTDKSFHIGGIYKVNDTCINLLGWSGRFGAQGESEPDIHIITDSALRLVSSNL